VRARVLTALVLALAAATAVPAGAQSPSFPYDEPDPAIADGSAQRALDGARRHWRRARIHDYRFELRVSCFCPFTDPSVIFVRHDRPLNAPEHLRSVATVRRLHRVVQQAINGKVHALSVRYGRRGIPRRIGIDGHPNIADDEVAYAVAHFWRGAKGRGGPDTPAPAAVPQ